MTDELVDPEVGHPARWKVLAVSSTGLFLLVSSLTSLNVALPDIERDLGADAADLQWIVDSYAVVFGGLLLLGGSIGDRTSRRSALIAGFALVSLGGIVGLFGGSVAVVIAARVITGLGGAILLPATLSALTEVFVGEQLKFAIALWSGLAGAGGAFGPAIGGWLLELSSWRAVFGMNAAIASAGLLAAIAVTPQLPGQRTGRIDIIGGLLSTATIGLLLFAVIEAPSHLGPAAIAGAAGVIALVMFVRHQAAHPDPMLPLRVFDNPRLRVGSVTLIAGAIGFAGVVFVASLLLQFGWKESALTTGLLLVPIGVTELGVSMRAPRLALRFGTGRLIGAGLVAMAAGYSLMAATPVGDRLLFVVAGAIAGLGNGLVIPLSVERIIGDAPPDLAGVTAGVNETSIEIGASLGVAILGGIQRVVFDLRLPDDIPADSLTRALEVGAEDDVLAAYRDGGRIALLGAAVAALIVIDWARRPQPGDAGT